MGDSAQPAAASSLELAVEIVAAYVSNNSLPSTDLPSLMVSVHAALANLGAGSAADTQPVEKATPTQVRKSITPDHLVSFEDGKPYKTLRRHLTLRGLTPEAYREKWGLPRDYPMTAQSYSTQRSELARALGLGQQRRKSAAADETTEPEAPPKARGRRKSSAGGAA